MLGRVAAAIAQLLKSAPAKSDRIAAQDDPAPLQLARGKGEAVIIVDGDAALVILVEQMLARLGYRPAGFASSQAALRALYEEPAYYDAVLIDAALPDASAATLAAQIRRVRRDMPILLMSGRRDADCTGVDALLRKPMLSCDIAAPLAQVLRERRR